MGAGRSDKREVASTAVTQQSNCKGNSDLRLIRTPDRYAGRAYACPRGLCVTLFPQPSPQMHGPGYQARAWRGALKGGRAGQQWVPLCVHRRARGACAALDHGEGG